MSQALTPSLDRLALTAWRLNATLWSTLAPLRGPADRYVRVTGLRQRWNMFANPSREDEYIRVRYHLVDTLGKTSNAAEIVFPALPEYEWRLITSFGVKHRDKAIDAAFENYRERSARRGASGRRLPDDLAPVLRYFVRRFERERLQPGQQILRAELWSGRAPNPLPGQSAAVPLARSEVLAQYYAGPVWHQSASRFASIGASEREADIIWRLEYLEPPETP